MAEKDKLAKLYDFLKHDVEVSFLDGDVIDVAMDVISKHIKMIKKLEKQNKRYREALEFYADEGTYEVVETLPPTDEYQQPIEPVFKTVPIIYYDKGKEARKALEE